jgi:MFS family permease
MQSEEMLSDTNGQDNGTNETYSLEAQSEVIPPSQRGKNPFTSLRYRDYRFFWMGALVSNVGTWMQSVAVGWVVYDLSKEGNPSFTLGAINFLNFLPITLLTLFAGVFADRVNRKRLIIVAQVLLMLQALALARLTQIGDASIIIIGGLVFFAGIITALVFPAWQAIMPDIVPRESLLNAIALNAAQFNSARLVGPLLGGLVFAAYGASQVFYINALSFLFVILALALIRPKQQRHTPSGQGALRTFTAGMRYARENIHVGWTLISVFMLSMFGMPYITLMPVFAAQVLGRDASGYSVLMAASGLGAVFGALFVASMPHTVGRDRLIRWGLSGMGVSLLLFSLSRNFYLSLAFSALAGFSFLTGMSAATTGVQASTPARLRGRVMALFVLCFLGMQPFSAIVFGSLGELIGVPAALGTGAISLALYAAFHYARPALLKTEEQQERT